MPDIRPNGLLHSDDVKYIEGTGRMDDAICDAIKQVRVFGVMHCAIIRAANLTVSAVAAQAGLRDTCSFTEIKRQAAYEVAVHALHRNLAYKKPIMSLSRARDLVDKFFGLFTESGTRCFTNINGYTEAGKFIPTTLETRFKADAFPGSYSWTPATSATFDLGIILLGNTLSGVLWVEDED